MGILEVGAQVAFDLLDAFSSLLAVDGFNALADGFVNNGDHLRKWDVVILQNVLESGLGDGVFNESPGLIPDGQANLVGIKVI